MSAGMMSSRLSMDGFPFSVGPRAAGGFASPNAIVGRSSSDPGVSGVGDRGGRRAEAVPAEGINRRPVRAGWRYNTCADLAANGSLGGSSGGQVRLPGLRCRGWGSWKSSSSASLRC